MHISVFAIFCVIAAVYSTPSVASDKKCKIDLSYGLVVNKNQIRVLEESRTVAQINYREQLFIGGRQVNLSRDEISLVREYAKGLHYVVPKMIVLASEGVDFAIDTIDQVYRGIVGSDHDSYEKVHKAMKRARNEIRENFRYASDHYFVAPGSLEQVDDFVDQQIEEQYGAAISTSLGGILTAIGGLNSADGNTQDRMRALSKRLEAMSVQLEQEVEDRAGTLRDKARWYCSKMEQLNSIEEKLRATVKQFEPLNIIIETQ